MSFDAAVSTKVWDAKYRFGGENRIEDSWRRVAEAAASCEPQGARAIWRARYEGALAGFKLLPGGRILAGAGTGRTVTLFNCFVMGTIPDRIEGIFRCLKEAALTMQQGGGVGVDFSTIRPIGAQVADTGAAASGPLSFMDVWDAMSHTIASTGQRRGAMMGCLRIDHPDIEAFIDAKRDARRLRSFNLSVLVTDAFMAVRAADGDWPLVFGGKVERTVRARALWNRLMHAAYDTGDPGVLFIDRINAANNLRFCETISAANPCGEQPLPQYGACLLASVNLARLVEAPFTERARLDETKLAELAAIGVRFLDSCIDISRYPLPAQEAEAKSKRRIGLGITGLADALIMCNARYGGADALALMRRWLGVLRSAAYRASAELAAEKGPFPLYDRALLSAPSPAALDAESRALIEAHGLRNGCLTTIAPAGSISLLAGAVSSGIEPVFAFRHTRQMRLADGSFAEQEIEDYAHALWRRLFGDSPLPAHSFVSAQTLAPADHLAMQAAAQAFIDSAISKTINCPRDTLFDQFADVYAQAYDLGCKGCTAFRPNPVTGAVLHVPDREVGAKAAVAGELACRPPV